MMIKRLNVSLIVMILLYGLRTNWILERTFQIKLFSSSSRGRGAVAFFLGGGGEFALE